MKTFLRRFTRIYRHLFSKSFENEVFEYLEMVQCTQTGANVLSDTNQKRFAGKFFAEFFGCVAGVYFT